MAISDTIKEKQTDIKLEYAYNLLCKVKKNLSKMQFAKILGKTRQNVGKRMGYEGNLHINEAVILLNYLKNEDLADSDLYLELQKSTNKNNNTDSNSSLLKGFGDSVILLDTSYTQGNSMLPDIKSGDTLLVDTSKTTVIDGVTYAFIYDGQPMCSQLQKIGNKIKSIPSNSFYDPFYIDKTLSFDIIGRVVGIMRQFV